FAAKRAQQVQAEAFCFEFLRFYCRQIYVGQNGDPPCHTIPLSVKAKSIISDFFKIVNSPARFSIAIPRRIL
ncbi:MAG: hypothetical protein Q3977_03470, partial [Oscillospiraceae bacterium]|nr:hypothetical protein [Oscillospiraceae bacterium]